MAKLGARIAGPVAGKTYSLYGQGPSSDEYFAQVAVVLDACLERVPDPATLLTELAAAASSVRRLRRGARRMDSVVGFACAEAERRLGEYFLDLRAHRASLSLTDRCSKTLTMSREQYLLCAIEIALRNRINATSFAACRERLAFLPHCLRDLDATCGAKHRGLDTVCMACSQGCYLNEVSRVLRRHRVRPYIWMSASLSRLLREQGKAPGALGILGIACIPELMAGMRLCARAGVPVLGLPLDANRCARWLGEFRQNTVNLGALERLLAGS